MENGRILIKCNDTNESKVFTNLEDVFKFIKTHETKEQKDE